MTRRGFKFKPVNKKKIPTAEAAAAAASPPSASPPWTELPSDLTANILQRLGAVEILQSAQNVCATWWNVCQNPSLWRVINIVNPDDTDEEFTMMCRRAVDRSQGQLIDLTIAYFGDHKLLDYIIDRSSHLQRLTLACCVDISAAALIEAVEKLRGLEELHLIMPSILAGDIETIGIICPMLKSFTFNSRPSEHPVLDIHSIDNEFAGIARDLGVTTSLDRNEHALAIAKSMPNLYHLQLYANDLNNEGLQAILDGCPRLESLDLRQCFGVDLGGPLGERCCKQIKDLRLPSDSIDDYEWDADDLFGLFDDASFSCSSDWAHYDDNFEFDDDYTDPFRSEYCDDDDAWFGF